MSDKQQKPKSSTNTKFEREILKQLGLPEDYEPQSEEEAYRLVISALED